MKKIFTIGLIVFSLTASVELYANTESVNNSPATSNEFNNNATSTGRTDCSGKQIAGDFFKYTAEQKTWEYRPGVLDKLFGSRKKIVPYKTTHVSDLVIDEARLEAIAKYCFPDEKITAQDLQITLHAVKEFLDKEAISTFKGCYSWKKFDYTAISECGYGLSSSRVLSIIIYQLIEQHLFLGKEFSVDPKLIPFIYNGQNHPEFLPKWIED